MKNTNRTRKIKIPGTCCETTFKGLNTWYKSVFEKLGWMVLAKQYGMTDQVNVYVNSIYRIHMAIEQKIKKTQDSDRLEDLRVMKKNVQILLAHVQKDFKK
jgi:Mg2+ and Co2+ transporter CorA